jgi:NADP-dependent 3-hydroxy acid dehydrogenase YdfG
VQLRERTGRDIFETLVVDLNESDSVRDAAAELARRHDAFDFLLLNAGMVAGSKLVKTHEDVEITFSSSLIGHHQLTMQLLEQGLLTERAHIVIAGSEAARGVVPTFHPPALAQLAGRPCQGEGAE